MSLYGFLKYLGKAWASWCHSTFIEPKKLLSSLRNITSKEVAMFSKLLFQLAFISKCLHHSENLSCPGLWYFWFIFLFGGIFFFLHMSTFFTHKNTHTQRIWSDLWSYGSLRKENKNVEKFWISAITMKNICWSFCKHKFILPWARLLIKIHILFSNKFNSYKFPINFFF